MSKKDVTITTEHPSLFGFSLPGYITTIESHDVKVTEGGQTPEESREKATDSYRREVLSNY